MKLYNSTLKGVWLAIMNPQAPRKAAFCAVLMVLGECTSAISGVVPDRAALGVDLAGFAPVTETFEGLRVGAGQIIPGVIDYSTPIYGFGSGFIVPGLTLRNPAGGTLQWNSVGWYGQPSEDINSSDRILEIDFSHPTPAFGLDLLVFQGFGDNATVNVYAADDVTLLTSVSGISVSDPSNPVFFGYQDSTGIGMVEILASTRDWSPLVDNLTFSTVPEPNASFLLLGGLFLASTLKHWNRKSDH